MLIDICFMKMSETVIEIQRGLEARMIDGQTSELKLLPWTWEMVAESCDNTLDSGPGPGITMPP